jgi:hypothetical protein
MFSERLLKQVEIRKLQRMLQLRMKVVPSRKR